MKLKKHIKRKPIFTKSYKLVSGLWGFREESSEQVVQYHHGFKTKKSADTSLKEKRDEV